MRKATVRARYEGETTGGRRTGRLPPGVDAKQVRLSRAGQGKADKGPQNPPGAMVFRAEGWLTAMTPNTMDSAVGRISRTNSPVDARVTAEHDLLWNFIPLCVWGSCTGCREKWLTRLGIIRIFKAALRSDSVPSKAQTSIEKVPISS